MTSILLFLTRGLICLVPVVLILKGGEWCGLVRNDLAPDGWAEWAVLPNTYFPDISFKSFLFRVIVEVMFGLWAILACLDARYRPRRSPILIALTIFVVVIALADVTGVDAYHSFWSNLERMEGLIGLLHLYAFFVVAASVMNSERTWRWFFLSSVIVCTFIAVIALAQFGKHVLGFDLPKWTDWMSTMHLERPDKDLSRTFRADARLGNPVYLALYMLFHVFIVTIHVFRRPHRHWRNAGWCALIGLYLFTVYNTATRSAWFALVVGLVVALALIAWQHRGRARRVALIALGSMGTVAVLFAGYMLLAPTSIAAAAGLRRFRGTSYVIEQRSAVWWSGIKGWWDRPILGFGQENFDRAFEPHFDPILVGETLWWDQAHNVFVVWLVAGGIVGLIAYVALLGSGFAAVWDRKSTFLSRFDKSWLTGMLVAYVVFNSFLFDSLSSYILFFAVIGYLHAMRTAVTEVAPRPAPAWVTLGTTVVALGLVPVVVNWFNLRPARQAAELTHAVIDPVAKTGNQYYPRIRDVLATDTFVLFEAREKAVELALQYANHRKLPLPIRHEFVNLAIEGQKSELATDHVRPRTLFMLGAFLDALNRSSEALPYLLRACEVVPTRPRFRMELANAYLTLGQGDKAMDALRTARRLAPQSGHVLVALAVGALRTGHQDEADAALELLHPADGGPRPANPLIVSELYGRKQYSWLIRIYSKLVEREEQRARVAADPSLRRKKLTGRYTSLATVYALDGQVSKGIATLQKAIAADPSFRKRGAWMIEKFREGKIPQPPAQHR